MLSLNLVLNKNFKVEEKSWNLWVSEFLAGFWPQSIYFPFSNILSKLHIIKINPTYYVMFLEVQCLVFHLGTGLLFSKYKL